MLHPHAAMDWSENEAVLSSTPHGPAMHQCTKLCSNSLSGCKPLAMVKTRRHRRTVHKGGLKRLAINQPTTALEQNASMTVLTTVSSVQPVPEWRFQAGMRRPFTLEESEGSTGFCGGFLSFLGSCRGTRLLGGAWGYS